jgi:hypothetical protein
VLEKRFRSPSTGLRTNGEDLRSLVFSVHAEALEAFLILLQPPTVAHSVPLELMAHLADSARDQDQSYTHRAHNQGQGTHGSEVAIDIEMIE